MPDLNINVALSGPFFQNDPRVVPILDDAINELVLRGEAEATQMAQPAPAGLFRTREYAAAHGYFQSGHYNRSINGRMVGSLHGVLNDSSVVYGPWLEGVSSRNETTRFRGYGIFRKTKEKLELITEQVLQRAINRVKERLS